MSQNKLYVGNLPYSVTEDELQKHFEEFGEVLDINLIKDRETGRAKGFGFVTMDSQQAAENSLSLNGKEVGGRAIRVNEARESGGSSSRGGRGGDRNRDRNRDRDRD